MFLAGKEVEFALGETVLHVTILWMVTIWAICLENILWFLAAADSQLLLELLCNTCFLKRFQAQLYCEIAADTVWR